MIFKGKYLLLLIFLYTSIIANESCPNIPIMIGERCPCNHITYRDKPYDQGYEINKNQLMHAYNVPARVMLRSKYHFFFEGDFLLWQPKEKGLTIGFIPSTSTICDIKPNLITNFEANYLPGFKVGIGSHYFLDDWSSLLQYTSFNQKTNNSINKVNFFSEWLESNVDSAKAEWNLRLNLFELQIERKNLTGKDVAFSPNFAINGGKIDQKYNVYSSTFNSLASSSSWLIGTKGGIKTAWHIRFNVKFHANLSAALFFQSFSKIYYESINNLTSVFSDRIRMRVNNLTPNLNFSSGLSFENRFIKKFQISLQVMYEIMHFWNQNQMRYLLNELRNTRFDAGSLMLHGLTASFRCDF